MVTTALNDPHHGRDAPDKEKPKLMGFVAATVLIVVAALLTLVYLMYRDAPTTGTPGKIDNAEGISPAERPVTPAEPGAPTPQR